MFLSPNERMGCKKNPHPVRYCSGFYFLGDGAGSAGLLAAAEELPAGFADSVAVELLDFEPPALDDFRA